MLFGLFGFLTIIPFLLGFTSADQIPVDYSQPKQRIAIIGAGAGGSAAAYYLQKYTDHGYDITVFDKDSRVGGRTTTTGIYGNDSRVFEVGGSVYVAANLILCKAAEDFNLSLSAYRKFLGGENPQLSQVGVYDGNSIILEFDSSWKTYLRLVWRYGFSPFKAAKIVKDFINTFLSFFYESQFPFLDLNSITRISGFYAASSITGEQYFQNAGVSESYYKQFLQTFTRVNYAQNLDQIHAVGALVLLAAGDARQIQGGNWQLFERMVEEANATLKLDTGIDSATKLPNGKWSLNYGDSNGDSVSVFDKVIIAAPFHSTNIKFSESYSVPDVEYVDLFVTIFTTNETLSPSYFGEKEGTKIPGTVLTTVPLSELPNLKFFSVAIHEYLEETGDYVFKIFSPEKFTDQDLAALFSENANISWIHRKEWRSYPYIRPVENFPDFELDDGLWYLNTMETLMSTMETSALAGANVAALISQGRNTTALTVP